MFLGLDIPTYHPPSTSGTPESQFPARGHLISSISAPRGARRTPCEVFCARETLNAIFGSSFCPRGVPRMLRDPPSQEKKPPGIPNSFSRAQNPPFRYHFRSSEGTSEWLAGHAGAFSSIRNCFPNVTCMRAIGDHAFPVNMSYRAPTQLKN